MVKYLHVSGIFYEDNKEVNEMPTVIEPIKDVHDKLCALWITWCKQNDMPEISADDLLHLDWCGDTSLTVKQAKFVEAFVVLWEIEND